MIHVVAEEVSAARGHHHRDCLRAFRRDIRPPLAVAKKARAGLDVGHRDLGGIVAHTDAVVVRWRDEFALFHAVHVVEEIPSRRAAGADPGIATPRGHHLLGRHGRLPRRSDIIRRHDTRLAGEPLEVEHMLLAAFALEAPRGRRVLEFILQLHRDHRPAVFEHQPLQLLPDLLIPLLHIVQIHRIVGAELHALLLEEIGHAAVPDLAVVERPNAREHTHPVLRTEFDEMPQVALAGPYEGPLILLVLHPEKIHRHRVDAAGLHLEDRLLPLLARIPRRVDFPGDHHPGLAVEGEVFGIRRKHIAGRIFACPFFLGRKVQWTRIAEIDFVDLADRRHRLESLTIDFGLGPIRVVHAIRIAAVADPQCEAADTGEIHAHFLRRLPGLHHAGFPKDPAIACDLEGHRPGRLRAIIYPHPRAETPRRPVKVKSHLGRRVRAEAFLKNPRSDRKRFAAD